MQQINYKQVLTGVVLMAAQISAVVAANIEGVVLPADRASASSVPANGLIVLNGDVLVGPQMMQRGIGVKQASSLWEDGVVPYYIDPKLQSYLEQIVKSAVHTWNSVAGITLVKIDPRAWDAPEDYLHFIPSDSCASWIGRQGGAQAVWTGPGCSSGSMIHEIGHALGLEHEHNRPDRDQHIMINWENVDSNKIENFAIRDSGAREYGPYDYASIMHYGELFFSSNDQPTIEPLLDGVDIGQRVAPSAGDINAIAMLYSSDLSLVIDVVTQDGKSEVHLVVTNEHFQGANQLTVSMHIGDAHLMSNSNPDWQCVLLDNVLTCTLERIAAAEKSSVTLLLDQLILETTLNALLESKTPDTNLINNEGALPLKLAFESSPPSSAVLADQQNEFHAGSTSYAFIVLGIVLCRRFRG